jgi:hypothetical protein
VTQIFLLSPAYCGGRRAAILLNPESKAAIVARLNGGALTLGEAFSFMSGLYFRGKLAYATAFGRAESGQSATFVITPTRGLQSPELPVTAALIREFAEVDISDGDPRYHKPLERDLTALAAELPKNARAVLLGSVATGKYVDQLSRILGPRLHFPPSFIGRGDMSRGGLLLRSARASTELEYAVLHPGLERRGARPAKLPKLLR